MWRVVQTPESLAFHGVKYIQSTGEAKNQGVQSGYGLPRLCLPSPVDFNPALLGILGERALWCSGPGI